MSRDSRRTDFADFLRSQGFEVDELPERRGQRSADLLAAKDQRYLIEVKSREDDRERLKEEWKALEAGEIVSGAEPTDYQDRLSEIIRDGVDQLAAHAPDTWDCCLLWLHAGGRFEDVQMRQFRSTLYGSESLFSIRDFDDLKTCYFFYESEFFRNRGRLDGAILSRSNEAQLCLNTLSPRYERLRDSDLVSAFGPGVCDPERLAAGEDALVADTDLDRRDADAVIAYLQQKYGFEHLQVMKLGHQWVSAAVQGAAEE